MRADTGEAGAAKPGWAGRGAHVVHEQQRRTSLAPTTAKERCRSSWECGSVCKGADRQAGGQDSWLPSRRLGSPLLHTAAQGAYLREDGALWGDNEAVLAGGWRNALAKPILAAAGLPYIDIWNVSVPLWYLHKRAQMIECTHSALCAYSLWTWQVVRALRDLG